MRFSTERRSGRTEAVQSFLDRYDAVLAALVDLTTARKRLDDVVASFTDHAYNQDAGARGVKGEPQSSLQEPTMVYKEGNTARALRRRAAGADVAHHSVGNRRHLPIVGIIIDAVIELGHFTKSPATYLQQSQGHSWAEAVG